MRLRSFVKGVGVGAALMYILDPDRGRRRRMLMRHKYEHTLHASREFWRKARLDLENRISGIIHELTGRLRPDHADDRVVTERVRATLGRCVSHPHAIHVESHNGQVTLSGPILAEEVPNLLQAVYRVRGVSYVDNQLEVHEEPGNVAALQGGTPAHKRRREIMQQNWSPATRTLAQCGGSMLLMNWLIKRDVPSALLALAGAGLITRATLNRSFGQIFGTQVCPQAVTIQKTVSYRAPLETVWELISDFEQLSEMLPNISHLESIGEGRYRFRVRLPMGQQLELEDRITEWVPYERIAWESTSDYPLSYQGWVLLQRESDERTRVNIHFEYTPPGGVLGDALASLFGKDAQSIFQNAIIRSKTLLELPQRARQGAKVS